MATHDRSMVNADSKASSRRRHGSVTSMANGVNSSSPGIRSGSSPNTPRSKRRRGCCGMAICRRRRSSRHFVRSSRPRACCRRRLIDVLRECARRGSIRWTPFAPRQARSRCEPATAAGIVAGMPTIVAAYLAAAARAGADRTARDLGHAANFLYMLNGDVPDPERVRASRRISTPSSIMG